MAVLLKRKIFLNIQTYDLKEINVPDGQLLIIFCSLIKSFVQMLLSSNLSLFGKENMLP